MQNYGEKAANHEVVEPLYAKWGLLGSTKIEKLTMVDNTYIDLLKLVDERFDYKEYTNIVIHKVEYFQGPESLPISAIWVRLNKGAINLEREHISLIYVENTKKLLAYTRMKANSVSQLPDHQTALYKAIHLLKQVAPDLINPGTKTPDLSKLANGERMQFNPPLQLDNVQLQWIGEHQEIINIDNKEILITGMKVKMYLPQTKLWAWVIVDGNGCIITFERNVSWDFVKMERQTQMWLHDKWLLAQQILTN